MNNTIMFPERLRPGLWRPRLISHDPIEDVWRKPIRIGSIPVDPEQKPPVPLSSVGESEKKKAA